MIVGTQITLRCSSNNQGMNSLSHLKMQLVEQCGAVRFDNVRADKYSSSSYYYIFFRNLVCLSTLPTHYFGRGYSAFFFPQLTTQVRDPPCMS